MSRWLRDHKASVLFVAFIVIGGALHFSLDHWLSGLLASFSSTFSMLADALALAGFLGLTVDGFLKKALVRDVGSIFIGWALPQKVREYIREVSQTSIVCRDRLVYIKLTLDGSGNVIADTTESFDVFNYSASRQLYVPTLGLDSHEHPYEDATTCEWTCRRKSKRFATDALVRCDRFGFVKWRVRRGKKLPSQDVNDKNIQPACTVRWQYRTRMPSHYGTLITPVYPTIKLSVIVDCPDTLQVDCDSDEFTAHADGGNQWIHDRLIPPHQSIAVRWRPKSTPSEASAG